MKLQLDRRLVLAGVLIVYGFGSQLSAQPADNARTQEVRFSIDVSSLYHQSVGDLRLRPTRDGKVLKLYGGVANPTSASSLWSDPYGTAIEFFRAHEVSFGHDRSNVLLAKDRIVRTRRGETIVRFTQRHQGVRVLWVDARVKYDISGTVVTHASLNVDRELDVDTNPKVLASEAAASASALLRSGRVVDIPELVIYSSEIVPLLERDVLAWSVVVDGEGEDGGLKSSTVLIDAHTGRPVVSFDNLQSTMNRWIYDLTGVVSNLPGTTPALSDRPAKTSEDAEVITVAEAARDSYDYYDNGFGWRSLDGVDGKLFAGARYIGRTAFFRPAVGTRTDLLVFSINMATKDIFTHEMGHSVISHSAGLVYRNQSGAANESFADVFGAFHDSANWTIGEGSAIGVVRNLEAPGSIPGLLNLPLPEHVNDYLCTALDNGGVHHNSSILNHAAYNLAVSIGRASAGEIYYDALTTCMGPTSGFTDTRDCVVLSASPTHQAKAQLAFDDVGLTHDAPEPYCGMCFFGMYVASPPDDSGAYPSFANAAYRLRDAIMPASEVGRRYAALYNQHTADLVRTMRSSPGLFVRGATIVASTLPGIQQITGSSNSATISASLISDVRAWLEDVAAADRTSGRTLQAAINAELTRIDWGSFAGKTFADAWRELTEPAAEDEEEQTETEDDEDDQDDDEDDDEDEERTRRREEDEEEELVN